MDYKSHLRRKKIKFRPVVRTVKKPGDIEIVYRDGEWCLHRYGEAA